MQRRNVIAWGVAALMLPLGASTAARAQKAAVYTEIPGVGAGGYDLVAYQTEGAARAGSPTIVERHEGIVYRFATEDNRRLFAADPARYLPEFGGYCAWAVANGYTAHGDPNAWSVVDGRLFLNYSRAIRSRWQRDTAANISKGQANWPRVLE